VKPERYIISMATKPQTTAELRIDHQAVAGGRAETAQDAFCDAFSSRDKPIARAGNASGSVSQLA